jgi:hypothetical protein
MTFPNTLRRSQDLASAGGTHLSRTGTVLSFEEGLLASRARQRLRLASPRLSGPKTLMLQDVVIGRERPRRGAVPSNRIAPCVEEAKRGAPLEPTEHAKIEAAIQLDLITLEQAEALVKRGKPVGEWLVEQEKGEAGKVRKVKLRMLDALGVLALLLFNLAVLVGFGWIVLRVLRSL